MRAFLLGLVLAGGAAHADTLSIVSVVPPTGYDASGGAGFYVLTPGFDSALGTLDGVSMTVNGTVQDTLFAISGNTLPFAAVFDNVGSISGYGFNESGVLSQLAGTASTLLAETGFAVKLAESTSQDLPQYASNAVISTDFSFYSTVTNAGTGQIVPYDSNDAVFSGTVAETFQYTAVPEPATAGIFALGLLAMAMMASRRHA